jgi:TonB-dependent starch-binding outer membrane protein SusC
MDKKAKLIILFSIVSCFLQAQTNLSEMQIQIPSQPQTIGTMLKYLEKKYGILFSYIEKDIPLDRPIVIKDSKLKLNELLSEIFAGTHIQFSISTKQVILRKVPKPNIKLKITGFVTDSVNNEPMAGTNIYIKGTNSGTVSNDDGSYFFNLAPGEYSVVFHFIGYKEEEQNIELSDDRVLNVTLKPSTSQIQEIKITKQRNFWGNMDLGRNITTLDSKKIEKLNNNNATDALQASMPGVWSTSTSGAPGDHQKVVIRGLNTLFGCTDPLYIVDGVAVPIVNIHSLGIADLNIHDIESITVLKDASSTSLYGYQGGNGVIIIDTKKYNGKSYISFSTKFGIQKVPRKLDLMNTKDFLSCLDTSQKNNIANIKKFYPTYDNSLQSTDWQDALFKNGIVHEYQLSGSGNFKNNRFYISGNYYSHGGIVTNSNYIRYTLNANVGRNVTKKLSLEINARSSFQKNKNNLDMYLGNDVIIKGINKSPLFNSTPDSFYNDPPHPPDPKKYPYMYTASRSYYYYNNFYNSNSNDNYFGTNKSFQSVVNSTDNTLEVNSNAVGLAAKYILTDKLFLNATSTVTFRNNYYAAGGINYLRTDEHYLLFNQQINLNYHRVFGNNEFTLVSGYRNYADNAYWFTDSITNNNLTGNYLENSLAINGRQGSVSRFIQSYSAHLNYNFKKKYFISLVANYEDLTLDYRKVGGNLFPSVAFICDISKEFGMSQVNWLNQFNVYTNIGITGNYPLNALSHDFYTNYNYYYPDTTVRGKVLTQLSNHDLKQEIITEKNIGTDIHLFNNRLRITADYYIKNSSNLILLRDIPLYYNGGKMLINIGKLENKGKELLVDADILNSNNFTWVTSFSISSNHQRVLYIGDENMLTFFNYDILIPEFEVKPNEEVGVIKGYKYLGIWTTHDAQEQNKSGNAFPYINSAGSKYQKVHKGSSYNLNDSDKIILGKTLPDYTWHWTNSIVYKNFSIDMVWYSVMGVSKYNGTKASTYMAATNRGTLSLLQFGRTSLSDTGFYQSSYFVEDASFLRLKQLTLSYRVPKKIYQVASIIVSLSFDNLITITKYSGYDPEASIYTDNTFSDFAVDRGAYPVPKSVFMTLKLDF